MPRRIHVLLLFDNLAHDDIRWVTVAEMGNYLFAPADEAIVEKLQEKKPSASH